MSENLTWQVKIGETVHPVEDLTAAYGRKAAYEDMPSVRDTQTGRLHRVVKITHPLNPAMPFYAIEA